MSHDAGKSGIREAAKTAASSGSVMAGTGAGGTMVIFGYFIDFMQKQYPDFSAWPELRNLGGAVLMFLVAGGAVTLARTLRASFVTLTRESDSFDKFLGGN